MIKLEEIKCNFTIVDLPLKDGLTLKKKKPLSKITIYDKDVINHVVTTGFNKKYQDLLALIISLNENEDTTESDTSLAFLKIADLRNHLLKYASFLNPNLLDRYLNMLIILGQKIPQIEKSKGR